MKNNKPDPEAEQLAADAALSLLVSHLPKRHREQAKAQLCAELCELSKDANCTAPGWVSARTRHPSV
jgi:hypothetical protein